MTQIEGNKSIQYSKNIIRFVSLSDGSYPYLLQQIADPPRHLYYRGKLVGHEEKCIAVIGSRNLSERGRRNVLVWIPKLVEAGYVIVSGLAIGIDSLVHETCLGVGGRTVAVVPAGVEPVYPRRNEELAERIVESGGCVMSEYPSNTRIDKSMFLRRNRIVSGLSLGVLVIEAGERSGSINTPGWAAEQGREVWCVSCKKGEENSEGVLGLIEDGASEVRTPDDIVATISI